MKFILLLLFFDVIENKKYLRIIGDRDAEENEYRYAARMEILIVAKNRTQIPKRLHICSSTILSPVWTLTAAHCVDKVNQMFEDTAHMNNGSKYVASMETRDIKAIIWFGSVGENPNKDTYSDIFDSVKHPAAKSNFLNAYPENDIGMFRTQPITLKQYAKLSALNPISLRGQEVDLVGFGLTDSSYGKVYYTVDLKKPLQILTGIITSCPGDMIMYPALCVARRCEQSSSLCVGDSGGPVIHPSGVVALTSIGIATDCLVSNPRDRTFMVGALTPISSYIDWISKVINNNVTSLK